MNIENEFDLINYAYFFIQYELISSDFIPKYVDNIISKEDNYPLYFIDLSLSKTLEEQCIILNDRLPFDHNNYKKLDLECILNQIKISNLNILEQIDLLFKIKTDEFVFIPEPISTYIYVLDNRKDMFFEHKYDLEMLKADLDHFFVPKIDQ